MLAKHELVSQTDRRLKIPGFRLEMKTNLIIPVNSEKTLVN